MPPPLSLAGAAHCCSPNVLIRLPTARPGCDASSPSGGVADAGTAEPRLDCLPPQHGGDLVALVRTTCVYHARDLTQPGPQAMVPITRGSLPLDVGLQRYPGLGKRRLPRLLPPLPSTWANDACELTDARSCSHHWVLSERARAENGVFVLRTGRARSRPSPRHQRAASWAEPRSRRGHAAISCDFGGGPASRTAPIPATWQAAAAARMGDSPLCGAAGCTWPLMPPAPSITCSSRCSPRWSRRRRDLRLNTAPSRPACRPRPRHHRAVGDWPG